MELVGLEAGPGELLGGFLDDAPGGAPPDQGDLGRGGALQDGRLQPRAHAVHLAHPLLVHLAADRGVGVLVADQDAVLVVVVGARDVDEPLASGPGAGGDPGGRERVTLVASVLGVVGAERVHPLPALDGDLAGHRLGVDGVIGGEERRPLKAHGRSSTDGLARSFASCGLRTAGRLRTACSSFQALSSTISTP